MYKVILTDGISQELFWNGKEVNVDVSASVDYSLAEAKLECEKLRSTYRNEEWWDEDGAEVVIEESRIVQERFQEFEEWKRSEGIK